MGEEKKVWGIWSEEDRNLKKKKNENALLRKKENGERNSH